MIYSCSEGSQKGTRCIASWTSQQSIMYQMQHLLLNVAFR